MISDFGLHQRMALRGMGFQSKYLAHLKVPFTAALPSTTEPFYRVFDVETQEGLQALIDKYGGAELIWIRPL